MSITSLLSSIDKYVLNPIIVLLFAVALLVFAWGILLLIAQAGNEEQRKKGKQALEWGFKGLFVMISVYGILNIVLNTFGIKPPPFLGF